MVTAISCYLLYGILIVFYVVLLFSMPQSWKENAAALLIYSDPAAMGLFFMGAIILYVWICRAVLCFGTG